MKKWKIKVYFNHAKNKHLANVFDPRYVDFFYEHNAKTVTAGL